jgi:hypothetical protein
MSAFVFAWPAIPQPRSGDSVKEHPGACGQARIAGRVGHDLSQLLDEPEPLVTIEDADRGEYLPPNVIAVTGYVGDRRCPHVVDEGRGVVGEQGEFGNLFPSHAGCRAAHRSFVLDQCP